MPSEKSSLNSAMTTRLLLNHVNLELESLPEQKEQPDELLTIELSSLRTRLRWAWLDSFLERLFIAPLFPQSALKENQDKTSSCSKRVWLQGRSLPIQNKSVIRRTQLMRNFLLGLETTSFTIIHAIFYGLLSYHL